VRQVVEDRVDRPALDDPAEIHDQHAVAEQADDIEG
jgi:hypothetical protein